MAQAYTDTASRMDSGMSIDKAPGTLHCRDCGEAFPFGPDERAWYAAKGFVNAPRRCPPCRAATRAEHAEHDAPAARTTAAAPCAACGHTAYVPFVPRLDKPVYCSACFDRVCAARAAATEEAS